MDEHQKQIPEGIQSEPVVSAETISNAGHPNAADFDDATRPGDLWPEAADARCSEFAALFAGTQPAPLSVV